jgi:hypothetical protein
MCSEKRSIVQCTRQQAVIVAARECVVVLTITQYDYWVYSLATTLHSAQLLPSSILNSGLTYWYQIRVCVGVACQCRLSAELAWGCPLGPPDTQQPQEAYKRQYVTTAAMQACCSCFTPGGPSGHHMQASQRSQDSLQLYNVLLCYMPKLCLSGAVYSSYMRQSTYYSSACGTLCGTAIQQHTDYVQWQKRSSISE